MRDVEQEPISVGATEVKSYRVVVDGVETVTEQPGFYAGWRQGKIFGELTCRSGMRMKKESRIFFANMVEAILSGYRPCKKCRPMDQENFDEFSENIPEQTLEEFYDRSYR